MLQRFSILASLVCALALALSQTAHAKETAAQAANRRAIVAAYAQMDRAMRNKDVPAMMSCIAPDFQSHSKNHGVFDRAGFEQIMRAMAATDTRVISSTTQITKLQWRGPDAIVWIKSSGRMESGRGTLLTQETGRHYWGKIKGRWQLRQEVTLTYSSTLNGRPLR